jgi:hypothetical protein
MAGVHRALWRSSLLSVDVASEGCPNFIDLRDSYGEAVALVGVSGKEILVIFLSVIENSEGFKFCNQATTPILIGAINRSFEEFLLLRTVREHR